MDVSHFIEEAGFTDEDRDAGTSGFCAMFALALYRALLNQSPRLVLVCAERDGNIVRARDGGIWWCHAAVKIADAYYDIEGRQQPEWMIDNYAWSIDPLRKGTIRPTLKEFSPRDFIEEISTTKSARDWRFYAMCKKKFAMIKS